MDKLTENHPANTSRRTSDEEVLNSPDQDSSHENAGVNNGLNGATATENSIANGANPSDDVVGTIGAAIPGITLAASFTPFISAIDGAKHVIGANVSTPNIIEIGSKATTSTSAANGAIGTNRNIRGTGVNNSTATSGASNIGATAPSSAPNRPTQGRTGVQPAREAVQTVLNDPDLQVVIVPIINVLPFVLIFLLKAAVDHLEGAIVLTILFGYFSCTNFLIIRLVADKGNRQVSVTVLALATLLTVTLTFLFSFNDKQLINRLSPMTTSQSFIRDYSLADTLFLVITTDFLAKFIGMMAKLTIIALPENILSFKKRGKFYTLIEHCSQAYRFCLTALPWACYLYPSDQYGKVGKVVSWVLFALYVCAKTNRMDSYLRVCLAAFTDLFQPNYANPPLAADLAAAGPNCPVCFSELKDPIQLSCRHIFCESCVATWFDNERTCPICRAVIQQIPPTWRNGSTSFMPQMF